MMQWVKSGTRSACLFGMLLAVLAGCNGSNSETNPESTFSRTEPSTSDDTKVPNEPVTGEVKIVPNTDPSPPVTTGGEPNPIEKVLEAAASKTRFIEIAPDTGGGQTFQSSPTFDYNLGNLVTTHSDNSAAFTGGKVIISPIKGWIAILKRNSIPRSIQSGIRSLFSFMGNTPTQRPNTVFKDTTISRRI